MTTPRKPPTDRVFFTAAALLAALAVPAWTATWLGAGPWWPVQAGPVAHGHEMLTGFAGALLGGFLFTRLSHRSLAVVFALWLAGRVAVLGDAPPSIQATALAAYALVLLRYGAWPFLRAAKTVHNAVPGLALAALCLTEGLYIAGLLGLPGGRQAGVMAALGLIALMLFAMGGRLIPAATSGALRAKSETLPMARRLQRRAEAVGAMALGLMAGLDGLSALRLNIGPNMNEAIAGLAGAAALVAGTAALLRLSRWTTVALRDQPALWPLHLGYGWLGAGLCLKALGHWSLLPAQASLHGLTMGGLGLLGTTVAWRTVRQRRGCPLTPARLPILVSLLLSAATLLRLAGATQPSALAAAAGLWTIAWLAVAGGLGLVPKGQG